MPGIMQGSTDMKVNKQTKNQPQICSLCCGALVNRRKRNELNNHTHSFLCGQEGKCMFFRKAPIFSALPTR